MNIKLSTNCQNSLHSYQIDLERRFSPSTFKYVRVGGLFDSVFEFLRPLERNTKHIDLYFQAEDDLIDEKMIENDFAVVSKDLLVSMKDYASSTKL